MELRHPTTPECVAIVRLVQAVVDEVYGGLWTAPPVPIGMTDWSSSWVAIKDGELLGVGLTLEDCVEDLWVLAKDRRFGTGSALLQRCEAEICGRGYNRARLRVVSSNLNAIRFYEAKGWSIGREYAHETFPIKMVDMWKSL